MSVAIAVLLILVLPGGRRRRYAVILLVISEVIGADSFHRSPTYRRTKSVALSLLFPPHLHQWTECVISRRLLKLEVVKCLPQNLLYTLVSAISQQLFDGLHEFCVKVLREDMTRVIGKDTGQHNRIILCVALGMIVFGEESADGGSSLFGSSRA